MKVIQIMA